MTTNELLDKPVWQMTGEELLFLAQYGNMSTSGETAKVSSSKEEKRYVYGLAGIARLFGCSLPTANRIKQSGKIIVPLHKSVVRLLWMPNLRWNWQGERREGEDEHD